MNSFVDINVMFVDLFHKSKRLSVIRQYVAMRCEKEGEETGNCRCIVDIKTALTQKRQNKFLHSTYEISLLHIFLNSGSIA